MVLLVLHGCAGVLWQTASQLLLHDIVPAAELQSAVRLNATGRYLGVLVGPAVGGVLMLTLGPAHGIVLNTVFYLPLLLWLWNAPYGPRFRAPGAAAVTRGGARLRRHRPDHARRRRPAGAGFDDRCWPVRPRSSSATATRRRCPRFAQDLGHGDPGTAYSMLLAADAAGALVGGFLLESVSLLRPSARTALFLAMVWCVALASFALARSYALALALLFVAGFFELSFSSMAQTLVQLDAPAEVRGRVLGLFNMSALGLRAFSGITVGIVGTLVGVHWSLAGAALCLLGLTGILVSRTGAARTSSRPR